MGDMPDRAGTRGVSNEFAFWHRSHLGAIEIPWIRPFTGGQMGLAGLDPERGRSSWQDTGAQITHRLEWYRPLRSEQIRQIERITRTTIVTVSVREPEHSGADRCG